jgi:hypothetical protein
MNGCRVLLALLAGLLGLSLAGADEPQAEREDLSHWEWYQEVFLPQRPGGKGLVDFLVPAGVFSRARPDLGDLRLVDGSGQPIPYALRIRKEREEQKRLKARAFNDAYNASTGVAELSLDLSEGKVEHNAIVVVTRGGQFRRAFRLEGGDDATHWTALLDKVFLVHFQTEAGLVEVKRFSYPPSRFRYLRLLVSRDRSLADDKPEIDKDRTEVLRSIKVAGEWVTQPARLGQREAMPGVGGPGSAWMIELGEAVPVSKLLLELPAEVFARPFALEVFNPGESPREVMTGQLQGRAGRSGPLEVAFPETMASRLRLRVTDYRNPPLALRGVAYAAAAREVIFEPPAQSDARVYLYLGNPRAEPPHYTFEETLPANLDPPPSRASLGDLKTNPQFHPLPRPWSERLPWLVDVVLGASSLVLLGILIALGRSAIRQHDAATREAAPTA